MSRRSQPHSHPTLTLVTSRNYSEKTIEGDLFQAFVKAGAISKANANDPKKSSLVRCARTDKNVSAAGNLISLKLIIEDQHIVDKINNHLTPQIRVWGFQRTVNSFSAYQACDSRWYEYFIPTQSFLPPHPQSWFAKQLEKLAEEADDLDEYRQRQEEVQGFWSIVEEQKIKPVLNDLPDWVRERIETALYDDDAIEDPENGTGKAEDPENGPKNEHEENLANQTEPQLDAGAETKVQSFQTEGKEEGLQQKTSRETDPEDKPASDLPDVTKVSDDAEPSVASEKAHRLPLEQKRNLDAATKRLRHAYSAAKRSYRIDPRRTARIQPILDAFLGTKNFHNYTVQKTFRDPSAKRVIKSFKVNPEPIVIDDSEWLRIKIHGQSFMMHQIRKMIGMVSLVIRCGCSPSRIPETFGETKIDIPKVPGLGLMLERPVFESYNKGAAEKFGRDKLGFDQYDDEIDAFKKKEIYERMFKEEAETNQFHTFFSHIDHFKDPRFLYLSSGGLDVAKRQSIAPGEPKESANKPLPGADSSDDDEGAGSEGEG